MKIGGVRLSNSLLTTSAICVVVAAYLFLPVTVFKGLSETKLRATAELSRRTGLSCTIAGPRVYEALSMGIGGWFHPDLSVTCASTNFAFSEGRDGTSKGDFTEELLKRYGADAEQFHEQTGVSIGLSVAGYGNVPLTCYRTRSLSKDSPPHWHVCRDAFEAGCNYGDCKVIAAE